MKILSSSRLLACSQVVAPDCTKIFLTVFCTSILVSCHLFEDRCIDTFSRSTVANETSDSVIFIEYSNSAVDSTVILEGRGTGIMSSSMFEQIYLEEYVDSVAFVKLSDKLVFISPKHDLPNHPNDFFDLENWNKSAVGCGEYDFYYTIKDEDFE